MELKLLFEASNRLDIEKTQEIERIKTELESKKKESSDNAAAKQDLERQLIELISGKSNGSSRKYVVSTAGKNVIYKNENQHTCEPTETIINLELSACSNDRDQSIKNLKSTIALLEKDSFENKTKLKRSFDQYKEMDMKFQNDWMSTNSNISNTSNTEEMALDNVDNSSESSETLSKLFIWDH